MLLVVSSSSGPGRLVLIQEIAGSTPAGTTMVSELPPSGAFLLAITEKNGLKSSVLHFFVLRSICKPFGNINECASSLPVS